MVNKSNNHLSPEIIEHQKKTMIYNIRNLGPVLGPTQNCGEAKPLYRIKDHFIDSNDV